MNQQTFINSNRQDRLHGVHGNIIKTQRKRFKNPTDVREEEPKVNLPCHSAQFFSKQPALCLVLLFHSSFGEKVFTMSDAEMISNDGKTPEGSPMQLDAPALSTVKENSTAPSTTNKDAPTEAAAETHDVEFYVDNSNPQPWNGTFSVVDGMVLLSRGMVLTKTNLVLLSRGSRWRFWQKVLLLELWFCPQSAC